jgi:hypothetical protein
MSEVEAAARGLLALDEEELITKLGLIDQFVSSDPNAASIDYLDSLPEPKGGLDDLLKAGKNIFGPASAGAYKVLCSDIGDLAKDSDLAQELTKLMDAKTAEASAQAAALLTPILASGGLPQSLALVVGTLLVKKLAKGSSDFICTNWKNNIEGTPSQATEAKPATPLETAKS